MAGVDDDLTLARSPAYSDLLSRGLEQLRREDEVTDFTIHTLTRSFPCHRAVLAATSPVLRALLRHGTMTEARERQTKREAGESQTNLEADERQTKLEADERQTKLEAGETHSKLEAGELQVKLNATVTDAGEQSMESNATRTEASERQTKLEHIEADVMDLLLTYMYTGSVRVPQALLVSTIQASDYLQLLELKEWCVSQAIKVCKPSSALAMSKLAELMELEALKTTCAKVISRGLTEVSKSEEFPRLVVAELSSLLSAAQGVADPDELLQVTLEWISREPEDRIGCLDDLATKIDLVECTVDCLERELEKHQPMLTEHPEAHMMFTKALVQIAKESGSKELHRRRRNGVPTTILLGGTAGNFFNKQCWKLKERRFVQVTRIPDHSPWFAVCETPTGFALMGGKNCQLCSVYHVASDSWETLASLQRPRHLHGAAYVHGKLMVFGGDIEKHWMVSVVCLEMGIGEKGGQKAAGEWTDGPDIPIAAGVIYPQVVNCNDDGLFLLDTFDSKQLLHLDPVAMVWSSRSPVPVACSGARMIRLPDRNLLVAGGHERHPNSTRMCARYDLGADSWTLLTQPGLSHDFGAMFYDCGTMFYDRGPRDYDGGARTYDDGDSGDDGDGNGMKVYLMAGFEEDRVEKYDVVADCWTVEDWKAPQKLYGLTALVL